MMPSEPGAAKPEIAARKPFYRELQRGRAYLWCACGRSKRQPFCDGVGHLGTGLEPLRYAATSDGEEVLFCGCKQTGTPPFCDGTHSNLPGGYHDEQQSAELDAIPWADPDSDGISRLDGACYAVRAAATRPQPEPRFWCRTLIAPGLGARHQSQFYIELRDGSSPVLSAGAADVIIWLTVGSGAIDIAERRFAVQTNDGVHVRSGEAFQLHAEGVAPMTLFVSVCPAIDALGELPATEAGFDEAWPRRVAGVDETQRHAMGPRYFQMLVDRRLGSVTAAQFIGHIPPSKAEMHRHLYEEALIILSGEGVIWNETRRARVAAGDVIFLPRKHAHSLQCTSDDGMDVVGVIHPGDNPGINY